MITKTLQGLVALIVVVAGIWYTFYVPATLNSAVTILLGGAFLLAAGTQAGRLLDRSRGR